MSAAPVEYGVISSYQCKFHTSDTLKFLLPPQAVQSQSQALLLAETDEDIIVALQVVHAAQDVVHASSAAAPSRLLFKV